MNESEILKTIFFPFQNECEILKINYSHTNMNERKKYYLKNECE